MLIISYKTVTVLSYKCFEFRIYYIIVFIVNFITSKSFTSLVFIKRPVCLKCMKERPKIDDKIPKIQSYGCERHICVKCSGSLATEFRITVGTTISYRKVFLSRMWTGSPSITSIKKHGIPTLKRNEWDPENKLKSKYKCGMYPGRFGRKEKTAC